MKKQTLQKSILCLLMALVCNAMWAQPAVSDAPADGQWAANTTWFQIKNQKNKAIRIDALTTEGYLALTNGNITNGDVGLWCIVGNETDGYKFYNRAKGTEVVLGMIGSEANASAVFVTVGTEGYATAFDIVASAEEGYWCVKEHDSTNNYWNQRDPRLAYWASDNAQKGDDGSTFLFSPVDVTTITGYATEEEITVAQQLLKDAPGYPKTTTISYRILNDMVNGAGKGIISADLTTAVNGYKTCTDIILPEDGKAYTFTSVMGADVNATKYYMKYENGKKVTVSKTESDASVFVCKELSTVNANEKKYAFITTDGNILTWIGNDEGGAYKENGNIFGYSSNYATVYNEKSDWNEITVKKNGNNANDCGYLRLVGRRKSDGFSSIIANNNNRFDQASDGYWFNGTNSSAWLLTEVTHENTDAQNLALAKIDATIDLDAKTGNLGENVGYTHYTINANEVYDAATVKGAIDASETVSAVEAIKNSYAVTLPKAGTAYKMTFKTKAGASHHFTVDGTNLSTSTDEGEASIFYCITSASKDFPYIFISANGKFLKFHEKGNASSANTLTDNYVAAVNNFKVEGMIEKSDNINSTIDVRLGTVAFTVDKRTENDGTDGCFVLKNSVTPPVFDAASAPFHNDNFTSAIIMTKVEDYTAPEAVNTAAQTVHTFILNSAKTAAKAHITANQDKLGEGIGYAYYTTEGNKLYTADDTNAAIDAATSVDEVNAIKESFKYEIPMAGVPYALYDAAHQVYIDINNLGKDEQQQHLDKLATLNATVQPLYITGNSNDGTWKIHTTPEGGNYLHKAQQNDWDSWVSSDNTDYGWAVDVSSSVEGLIYKLKKPTGGYIGTDVLKHTTGESLYADANDTKALKLTLIALPVLTISDMDAKDITYPYALSDEQAAKVFGQNNLTIAIDVTMPASLANNTRYALLCAADPTQAAATEATKANSSYIAYGLNGNNPAYMPSSHGSDKFSYRKASFTGNTTYKVVYVVDKINNKFLVYINGVLINMEGNENYPLSGYELQSFGNFSTADGDKLYIGGGIVGNTTEHDKFGGTIHSVKFYNYALTAEEVAAIEYPITDKQQDIIDRTHIAYRPTTRATTLESGKKYMIYNTAFNGNEDRTGFLYDNGAGIGHSGAPKKKPATFKNINEAYLWEIETTGEEGKYYLKAADGGYVNATGKTDNAEPVALYIQPWNTSTTTKAGVKSEAADGTVTENANIGADVFTIGGTKEGNTNKDCWNGNPNEFSYWESSHPFAFYEVEETSALRPIGSPIPGHTYYIYCANDTRQYFYNDGGTLKVSAERTEWSNEYLFTCSYDGEYFQFKNMKGKYLKHQGLQDAAYNFELAEYLDGVNLKTPGGSYFVMKADGGFDQSSKGDYDPATTGFSTVYKFEEFTFLKDGETYYIYSDTYKDGEYVNRYLYTDGNNLKLNTSLTHNNAYVWTCIITQDGHVQFRNGEGKYLKHRGIQDTPYDFTANKFNSTHAIAATLYSNADGGRYFAVKNDGSAFDQSTVTSNQTTGDWCTDFVFEPCLETKKALKLLIAETQELVNSCYNYYHEEVALQTTDVNGDYYVSTNAQEDKEGPIANLVDGDNNNHFHTEYSTDMGGNHYININLGSNNSTKSFKFKYATRKAETNFPKTIEISGSNDGETFTPIKTVTNLPVGKVAANVFYVSDIIESAEAYTQLRFTVTANNSDNKEAGGNPYFHMAEFDLMPRQAECVSSFPNSTLVPSALTAANEGITAAEATIETIQSMDEYENSLAELKVVHDEIAGAVANGNRPILISLDSENPYIYKIGIKRGDTKVLQPANYENKLMVAVVDYDDTNMEQAWYFTKGSDDEKVFIHPYMAGGNVLSASSTNNNPNAVWAAEKGTVTHQEWIVAVVDQANGTYNIKAGDGSNYFSNNGGTNNKMGFWNDKPTTDGGSLFTFTHVELKDILEAYKDTHCAKESYVVGETLGYYQGGATYNEARVAVVEVLADEEATAEDYKNAYIALRDAKGALKFLTPEVGKFYRIKSVAGWNDDAPYLGAANSTAKDGRAEFVETADANTIFYFDGNNLLSYGSGLYLVSNSNFLGYNGIQSIGSKIAFHEASNNLAGAGAFNISFNDGGRWLYCHTDNYTDAGGRGIQNGYCFNIEEITELPIAISGAGYTTLFAPTTLEIPSTVEAYVVSEVQSNSVLLQKVEGVVPAETGLIIKGNTGNYTFSIGGDATAEITANELKGTVAKSLITPDANTTCYVLANGTSGVGLYKASLNKDANGATVAENGVAFINNAYKVYLPVKKAPAQAARALTFRFGRDNEGTTDLEKSEIRNEKSEMIFDLAGRRIEKIVEKGMYIVNGKKVVIR